MLLVGDLATNPGTDVNKDCKVWEFKLRDGLKYEDGSAITSKDVAYGIARSFAPELNEGPHYIQQWLYPGGDAYNATYKGPYDGGADAGRRRDAGRQDHQVHVRGGALRHAVRGRVAD